MSGVTKRELDLEQLARVEKCLQAISYGNEHEGEFVRLNAVNAGLICDELALLRGQIEDLTRPGERSPELMAAEECLRIGCGRPGTWESLIAAHLDALRARLAQAEALPRKGSCYDCGGTGCESCDGTGDAGTQVLKLKNRLHDAEVLGEQAESELASWKAATECSTPQEAHDGWDYACEERDAETVRADKAEAENAELRALCGRAARGVPMVSELAHELKVAARRAGK